MRILGAASEDTVSPRWRTPFARQVDAVRRQLAILEDADLLAASYAREAFHAPSLGRVPAIWASPVRAAYAVRWIELRAGIALPSWRLWFP